MRKLYIFVFIITLFVSGCDKYEPLISNKDKSFPDYDYTSVYFPIQYPIRSIDLATDARINNSIDLQYKFHIGISMGGVYNNNLERRIKYEYAPDLLPEEFNAQSNYGEIINSIKVLPPEYYTLSPPSGSLVTIPAGQYSGLIQVQLTDGFFADSLSFKNKYVIPLRIVEAQNIDSILAGSPIVPNPVVTNPNHWDPGNLPRNFTFFMVKFINKFHGNYFLRGADYTLDQENNRIDSIIYRQRFLTDNTVANLNTSGLNKITTNNISNLFSSTGDYSLCLEINNNNQISITESPGAILPVTGSGVFKSREDSNEIWGGEKRRTMYLHYNYERNGVQHEVFDTLVFRTTDTRLEFFQPIVP